MTNKRKKPEVLSPAGSMEKLKIAIKYGADAVFMSGKRFSLRAQSKNFRKSEMQEAVEYAHKHNVKVYIVANIFAKNSDFTTMGDYFIECERIGVDALIIADPGIFSIARKAVPKMDIHISTQANNTNYEGSKFWHDLGAKRVILAREVNFKDTAEIKKRLGDEGEIEIFVHGSMCMAYSGRCMISNYTSGRDSNKGMCDHSCRKKYNVVEESAPGEFLPIYEDEEGTYLFSSKDLCLVEKIPQIIESNIESLKIEGRMKSIYYVATATKIYRQAIDAYFESPENFEEIKQSLMDEICKTSHRDFTTGFFDGDPKGEGHVYSTNTYLRTCEFLGVVLDYDAETKMATIEQRNKFSIGEEIEFAVPKGEGFKQIITEMYDDKGSKIESAPHAQQIIKMKVDQPVEQYDMIRKYIV